MPSGVDKRALERLIAKLKAAAGHGGVYDRLKKVLAATALTEVGLGFRESRDPYGSSWAPLAVRRGKPLLDTARLRNSFAADLVGNGFRIGTKVRYARVHQRGAVIVPKRGKFLRFPISGGRRAAFAFARKVTIPKRQMVPEGRLGPIWSKAFERVAAAEIARFLRRRGR